MKILTIFPYFANYSEPLCATYASFGGGGSYPVWARFELLTRYLHRLSIFNEDQENCYGLTSF